MGSVTPILMITGFSLAKILAYMGATDAAESTVDKPYGNVATPTELIAGIPKRPFLWYMDQIYSMLGINEKFVAKHAFREGLDFGKPDTRQLRLINIAPTFDEPEWRVDDRELRRFCRRHRIPVYDYHNT